jgi:hypothetical protein
VDQCEPADHSADRAGGDSGRAGGCGSEPAGYGSAGDSEADHRFGEATPADK